MAAPDVGVREAARAMKMGALGVQIYTNVAGRPLDNPEFEPFWKAMNKTGTPIWLHPSRTASFPDYQTESKSKYEIWWTLGWSYETAAAMSRLVFSKIMDKYPKLKIITHHIGGIVPMLEGRIGPGWDQIGARTSDEDLQKLKKSLKKRPLRLLQGELLLRHRGVRRQAGDRMRPGVLSDREDRVRLRLPVRSREGHLLHPRDAEDSRRARHVEGQVQGDHARQPGEDHRPEAGEVTADAAVAAQRAHGRKPMASADLRHAGIGSHKVKLLPMGHGKSS